MNQNDIGESLHDAPFNIVPMSISMGKYSKKYVNTRNFINSIGAELRRILT